MRLIINKLSIILLLMCMMLPLESCNRKSRHARIDNGRVERVRSRHSDDNNNTKGRDKDKENQQIPSNERLKEIAESDDYDAMLKELHGANKRLRALQKEYFKGNLTDKQLSEEKDKIEEAYKPIEESLSKASSEGKLNYKQHKQQMKLIAEFIKLISESITRVVTDFENSF